MGAKEELRTVKHQRGCRTPFFKSANESKRLAAMGVCF